MLGLLDQHERFYGFVACGTGAGRSGTVMVAGCGLSGRARTLGRAIYRPTRRALQDGAENGLPLPLG